MFPANWTGRKSFTLDDNSRVKELFSQKYLEGTKYNAQGAKAQGLMQSMAHGEQLYDHIEQTRKNYGNGFVRMTVHKGSNGKLNPVNINGRIFTPDAKGEICIVDGDFLDEQLRIHKDKMDYINSIIERASLSDDICGLVLGLKNDKELKDWLSDRCPSFEGVFKNSQSLYNVDAMPSAISTYDETSMLFSQAVQKFRLVITHFMPIINKLTPDKIVDDNTPKA